MFVAPAFAQTAGETHSSTGVPGADHGSGVFPPFDSSHFASQIFWLAVSFGLFYLFLSRVIVPRMASIIDGRNAKIAKDLDQAAAAKAEADAAIAAYEQELADARASAGKIGQQARDNAKVEAEAARKKVEASLDAKLTEAEGRIAAIKDSALKDVGAIAEETAAAIVQQLSGTTADKAALSAAVRAAKE